MCISIVATSIQTFCNRNTHPNHESAETETYRNIYLLYHTNAYCQPLAICSETADFLITFVLHAKRIIDYLYTDVYVSNGHFVHVFPFFIWLILFRSFLHNSSQFFNRRHNKQIDHLNWQRKEKCLIS